MAKEDVLVAITASRKNGEIVYRVDSSTELTKEEFDYYLGELINGLCKWRPNICAENSRSLNGTLKEKKTQKHSLK